MCRRLNYVWRSIIKAWQSWPQSWTFSGPVMSLVQSFVGIVSFDLCYVLVIICIQPLLKRNTFITDAFFDWRSYTSLNMFFIFQYYGWGFLALDLFGRLQWKTSPLLVILSIFHISGSIPRILISMFPSRWRLN